MTTIELIYARDCPNLDTAREIEIESDDGEVAVSYEVEGLVAAARNAVTPLSNAECVEVGLPVVSQGKWVDVTWPLFASWVMLDDFDSPPRDSSRRWKTSPASPSFTRLPA